MKINIRIVFGTQVNKCEQLTKRLLWRSVKHITVYMNMYICTAWTQKLWYVPWCNMYMYSVLYDPQTFASTRYCTCACCTCAVVTPSLLHERDLIRIQVSRTCTVHTVHRGRSRNFIRGGTHIKSYLWSETRGVWVWDVPPPVKSAEALKLMH